MACIISKQLALFAAVSRISYCNRHCTEIYSSQLLGNYMRSPFRHLIVLMLENRSFDHILGYSGITDAGGKAIDGLQGPNLPIPIVDGQPIPPTMDADFSGDFVTDPGHDFKDVNTQLFG